MKKVHLVCYKNDENSSGYYVLAVFSSKKKALDFCRRMDRKSPEYYHFTFEEVVN